MLRRSYVFMLLFLVFEKVDGSSFGARGIPFACVNLPVHVHFRLIHV
jgi:hypothetical protein